jgi:hypothetical protein
MLLAGFEGPQNRKTVIFLHIPKAAGSTMRKIITREYSKYSSESVYLFDGSNLESSIEKFRKLPKKDRNRIKILKGHMSYGYHDYFDNKCEYFTLLRDPIDRVISDFYYILEQPSHSRYEKVKKGKMSLYDYLRSKMSVAMANAQTRLIAGYLSGVGDVKKKDLPFGKCTEDTLNKAEENLKDFSVVGLTERFDETLILLMNAFGWKTPYYTRANVTGKRPKKREVSEKSIQLIKDYNKYDIQLYNYGKKLFYEQIEDYGPSFEKDLERFKKKNRSFQKYSYFTKPLIKGLYKLY